MSSSPLRRRVVEHVARLALPSHRRWLATLQSCTLVADEASRSLGPADVLLCGCPRSGTALLTASLFQAPTMVTVMEPWDGLRMPLEALYPDLRAELATGQLNRGRLRLDDLRSTGRVTWQRDGEHGFAIDTAETTVLGVKWPCYWQFLGLIPDTKFIVCVRDPAEVIPSFAAKGGRLAKGLEYDVAFNKSLNDQLLASYDTDKARRIGLYDAVYERVLAHEDDSNVFLVRYERWFSEPSVLLEELSTFLGIDVTNSLAKVAAPTAPVAPAETARIRAASTTAERLGYR